MAVWDLMLANEKRKALNLYVACPRLLSQHLGIFTKPHHKEEGQSEKL